MKEFANSSGIFLLCTANFRISINKNIVLGDTSAINPGGVRLGTAAITSRGFNNNDIEQVASILHRAIQVSLSIQVRSLVLPVCL